MLYRVDVDRADRDPVFLRLVGRDLLPVPVDLGQRVRLRRERDDIFAAVARRAARMGLILRMPGSDASPIWKAPPVPDESVP